MSFKPKTIANIENYTVSNKIEVIKGIILKEKYIIRVWGYNLAVYESRIFAGTALYH